MEGKYKGHGHKDKEEILELWWVQGVMTKIKKIRVKPGYGRVKFDKKGKKLSTALPWDWHHNAFYDYKSAEEFHRLMKIRHTYTVLQDSHNMLADAIRLVKEFDPEGIKDISAVEKEITRLYVKYGNYDKKKGN